MAAPNRWAIREAGEATFFHTVTGEAIVTLRTLKMTDVETTGETVYARGGRGNAKIVGFSSNREAKITLQDAIFDNKAMAMLTGNEVIEGAKSIVLIHDGVTSATGEITIPGSGLVSVVSAHQFETDGISIKAAEDTVSFVGQVVTIGTLNAKPVRVYYTKLSDASTKTVKVSSDKFAGTFKLVVDVMVRSEEDGQDYFAQFVANRVKMEDNFTFNFSPDGDPSVLDLPLEILKDPTSTDMWELIIYGQA